MDEGCLKNISFFLGSTILTAFLSSKRSHLQKVIFAPLVSAHQLSQRHACLLKQVFLAIFPPPFGETLIPQLAPPPTQLLWEGNRSVCINMYICTCVQLFLLQSYLHMYCYYLCIYACIYIYMIYACIEFGRLGCA